MAQPAVDTVVMKFGGSSVADPEKVRHVARRFVEAKRRGLNVVGTVSAMGKTTDSLIALAHDVSPTPNAARARHAPLDGRADRVRARRDGDPRPRRGGGLAHRLAGGHPHGRGAHEGEDPRDPRRPHPQRARARARSCSSPASRASRATRWRSRRSAAAAPTRPRSRSRRRSAPPARSTRTCAGVFTADPRIVPEARKLPVVSYDEMLEMSASGAKVLMLRSVELARNHGVRIHARSTFSDEEGTWVQDGEGMEQPIVSARHALGDGRRLHAHRHPRPAGRRRDDLRRRRPRRTSTSTRSSRTSSTGGPRCRSRCRPRTSRRRGSAIETTQDGARRLRRRGEPRSRQGVADRRRHALAPGRRGEDVPHARRARDQPRDDLDLADQDLLHDRPRRDPGRGARAPRRVRARARAAERASPRSAHAGMVHARRGRIGARTVGMRRLRCDHVAGSSSGSSTVIVAVAGWLAVVVVRRAGAAARVRAGARRRHRRGRRPARARPSLPRAPRRASSRRSASGTCSRSSRDARSSRGRCSRRAP